MRPAPIEVWQAEIEIAERAGIRDPPKVEDFPVRRHILRNLIHTAMDRCGPAVLPEGRAFRFRSAGFHDQAERRIQDAIAERLRRQHSPAAVAILWQKRLPRGLMVEIFADDRTVEQVRAILQLQRGNLAERIAAEDAE